MTAAFLGDGTEPVWPADQKVDIPLNERRGARVDIGPHRFEPVPWDNLIRSRGCEWTDTDSDWTHAEWERGGAESDWHLYIDLSGVADAKGRRHCVGLQSR